MFWKYINESSINSENKYSELCLKLRFWLLFKYTLPQARFRNLLLYLVSIGINKIFNGCYIIEP